MNTFTTPPARTEWDDLRYPVMIESEPDGQGFYAWIPLLGRGAFMADGETVEEALNALEALRREQYDLVIASGRPIPLPEQPEEELGASGKWLQRTTPRFHQELKAGAAKQGVSLNEYANQCLMIGHTQAQVTNAIEKCLSELEERMRTFGSERNSRRTSRVA